MNVFIDRIWDDRYGAPGSFKIVRCVACSQMATTPRLREADLPNLYSTYYPRRGVDYEAIEREANLVTRPGAALRRWLDGCTHQGHYLAKPGDRVLDIGSGSCISLLELHNLGAIAFGVEADPNVAAIAAHFDLNVHIGSIHDTPFPGQSFDLITLNQVIEHVPDPAALLTTVRDRLAPGGTLVLSFPNAGSLARRLSGSRWINWHVPYHQHHFNRRSITLLAKHNGYRVSHVRSVTPNLWTVLQLRAMRAAPPEGQASSGWSHAATSDTPQRPPFGKRLVRALLSRMRRMVIPLIAVVNRIVDQLGFGDSLVVVLKSTKETS